MLPFKILVLVYSCLVSSYSLAVPIEVGDSSRTGNITKFGQYREITGADTPSGFRNIDTMSFDAGIGKKIEVVFDIENRESTAKETVIVIPYPHTDFVQAELISNGSKKDLGSFSIYSSDPNQPRVPTFRFMMEPEFHGKLRFIVESKGPLLLKFFWFTDQQYITWYKREVVVFSAYLGIISLVLLFFSIFYFLIREKVYALYVMYTFLFALLSLEVENLSFFTNMFGIYKYQVFHLIACTTWITFLQFSLVFLNFPQNSKKEKTVRVMQLLFGIQLIFGLLDGRGISEATGAGLNVLMFIVMAVLAISDFRRSRNAKFYFAATAVIFVVAIGSSSQMAGLHLGIDISDHMILLVSSFEMLGLGLGLADRVNQLNVSLSKQNVKLQDLNKLLEAEVKQRENANTELKEQYKLFMDVERFRLMGEMAATIVHEVKNPIFSIQIRNQQLHKMLQSQNFNRDAAQELVTKTETAVHRVNKIIHAITHFSRNETNLPHERVDLRDLLRECLDLTGDKAVFEGAKLEHQIPLHPLWIKCRSSQICQIIVNLISNAIDEVKSHEEKWIRVSLAEDESTCYVRVTNPGKKLTADFLERFLNSTFSTKGEGVGMGLRIATTLAQQHNGSIYIDDSNEHTTFVLKLPKTT